MATAGKPESFVWIVDEVELLLQLTLNYKESKLQDRLNIFCGTNTSMQSAIVVVVVVMRHRRVQRLKARGRGVGRWHHRFGKYADSLSTREQEGCVFSDFSTLRPIFKKVCFQALHFQDPCGQLAKMLQYMLCFRKRAFSSGRPLSLIQRRPCLGSRDVTVIGVTVNHGKIPDGEG